MRVKSSGQKISSLRHFVNGDKSMKNVNTLMLSLRIIQGIQFTVYLIKKLSLINAQLSSISPGIHVFGVQWVGGFFAL